LNKGIAPKSAFSSYGKFVLNLIYSQSHTIVITIIIIICYLKK